MITRKYYWTNGNTDITNESSWENTFTITEECNAVRFDLTAYGWKPNASDEDLSEIYPGRYKIYSKGENDNDYTLAQVVVCERADTISTSVYISRQADLDDTISDVDFVLDSNDDFVITSWGEKLVVGRQTLIKIVAVDASKYSARGGTVEGISSGGTFWSNLKVRIRNSS